MLPTTRRLTPHAPSRSPLRRGIAAALALGLAAGVVTSAASPAAAAVTSYTSGSFTIGDWGPSTPSPVTVTVPAGTGVLESLTLTLFDVQHAHYAEDMLFDLRSPSGVQVRIGCQDWTARTTFSDGNSCQPLTPFYGVDPGGTWELYPYDNIAAGDDPNTRFGGFTLTLDTADVAPAITAGPSDVSTTSGTTVTFTSTATGVPAPSAQWQVDTGAGFADIVGATSADYTFTAMYGDSGNRYQVVYTNTQGSVTSGPALLTVAPAVPAVTLNPADAAVASGDVVSFEADADSEVAQTVQWQSAAPGGSFADIAGATSPTLTFTAAFADDGFRYRAVFTNATGSTPTAEATLAVSAEAPAVTSDPADLTVVEGQPATFSASASGDPVAQVQWQVSTDAGVTFTDVAGANLDTLTLPTTDRTQHLSLYRAVFTNVGGSATTEPAALQVHYAPEVVVEPADATNASGGGASFTAEAAGRPAPTVQWQVSTDGGATFADVDGATAGTLDLSGLTFAESGNLYRARFTNAVGSVTTRSATLTVSAAAPVVTTIIADQTVVAGTRVTFTAAASGDPTPTVQWRVSTDGGKTFTDIVGATQAAYSFVAAKGDDGNRYVAVFTNAGGVATTGVATLTVTAAAPLAVTGADVALVGVAALVLIAAGAATTVVARRRQTAS